MVLLIDLTDLAFEVVSLFSQFSELNTWNSESDHFGFLGEGGLGSAPNYIVSARPGYKTD